MKVRLSLVMICIFYGNAYYKLNNKVSKTREYKQLYLRVSTFNESFQHIVMFGAITETFSHFLL